MYVCMYVVHPYPFEPHHLTQFYPTNPCPNANARGSKSRGTSYDGNINIAAAAGGGGGGGGGSGGNSPRGGGGVTSLLASVAAAAAMARNNNNTSPGASGDQGGDNQRGKHSCYNP